MGVVGRVVMVLRNGGSRQRVRGSHCASNVLCGEVGGFNRRGNQKVNIPNLQALCFSSEVALQELQPLMLSSAYHEKVCRGSKEGRRRGAG